MGYSSWAKLRTICLWTISNLFLSLWRLFIFLVVFTLTPAIYTIQFIYSRIHIIPPIKESSKNKEDYDGDRF